MDFVIIHGTPVLDGELIVVVKNGKKLHNIVYTTQ